jgi:hypothetical protein
VANASVPNRTRGGEEKNGHTTYNQQIGQKSRVNQQSRAILHLLCVVTTEDKKVASVVLIG